MKKMKKNSLLEARGCTKTSQVRILAILFLAIFTIGTISAFEFDNVKSYNATIQTITITNAFGLGSDIAYIQLLTPPNNYVIRGKDRMVAEFKITNVGDYNDAFNDMKFYDLAKDSSVIPRQFTYKYKTVIGQQDVDDTETTCEDKIIDEKNNTIGKVCSTKVIGTHKEDVYGWTDIINPKELLGGTWEIGVFTDVLPDEHVEWIPKLFGLELNEWATWTEALNVNLIDYWNFDLNNSAVAVGSLNYANLTLTNNPNFTSSGKIGGAMNFTILTSSYARTAINVTQPSTNYTINGWVNLNTAVDYAGIYGIGKNTVTDSNQVTLYGEIPDINALFYQIGNATNTVQSASQSNVFYTWRMLTLVIDASTSNTSFYINGVLDTTGVMGGNLINGNVLFMTRYDLFSKINGALDEVGLWNRTLTQAEITQLYNGGTGITYTSPDAPPVITLNAPANNTNSTNSTIKFNVTATDDRQILNVTLFVDNFANSFHIVDSNISGYNGTYIWFETALTDDDYHWYVRAWDNNSNFTESGIRSFNINSKPTITYNAPANATNSTNNFMLFNATVTDIGGGISNVTLYLNGTLISSNTSGYNGTYLFNVTTANGDNNWSINATNGTGVRVGDTRWFFQQNYFSNGLLYNSTTYETSRETFYWNVTTNGSVPTGTNLIHNGTVYSATATNTAGNYYNISATVPINTNIGNQSFYFNMTLDGVAINSSSRQQNVSAIYFGTCNATNGNIPYLNYTFQIETNLTYINGAIPASTYVYWLGAGGLSNKTISYVNNTENSNATFCFYPANKKLFIDEDVAYESTSYPQRVWNPANRTFTNATTNTSLLLLGSSDGIYVTFQVVNSAQQVLEGTVINISNSGGTSVGTGTTGSDGAYTFWLNPDTTYTATFTKSPYEPLTATQQFTQTSYTITLGSTTTSAPIDTQAGIDYSVKPIQTYLQNGTVYNFNFTISSSFYSLDWYGFNITNGTGVNIASASGSTSTGSTIGINVNTSGNTSFIMHYYWIINGNITNATRIWTIMNLNGSDFSILHLANDFKTFVGTGLFGLDDFGVGIICFLLILGTTGILKMKTGVSNTTAIIGVAWAFTALLDVGLEIIPNPVNAIPHFVTVFAGIVFMGITFKEVFT